jgi:hypothetical protein
MKKGCLTALGIFAGLAILVIGYFWLNFYHVHVRYRLTVEVRDDDQIKTGSSVIDVSYNIQPDRSVSLGGSDTHPRVVGYAPTVDLGEKGMLFLTFANASRTPAQRVERNKRVSCPLDDVGCLAFAAYDKPGTDLGVAYSQQKVALNELLRQSGPRDVPFIVLPEFVRFRDIDDPHTLVSLPPTGLAASFGAGIELKRVTLRLTDDAVTPAPDNWPQWLKVKNQNTTFRGYEND